MKLSFVAALAASFFVFSQASAQVATPPCDGDLTIIRISKIKPGSTVAQFQDAARDHMAWYRGHGFTKNVQLVARVLVPDPKTGHAMYSPDEVVTIHRNAPGVPTAQQDAGWSAYVAKYRAVSDIETEKVVCVPKE